MSDDPLVTAWEARLLSLGTSARVFADYPHSARVLAEALAQAQRTGDLSLVGIPGIMERCIDPDDGGAWFAGRHPVDGQYEADRIPDDEEWTGYVPLYRVVSDG